MLSSMADAGSVGLDSMPPVETVVASLAVQADEALRSEPRCPQPEYKRTDTLVHKTYSAVANVGCITNTLAQLLLALNASLPSLNNSGCAEILQASLQAVGAAASECGRSLGLLTQLRKQVWLAQSPLPESGKNIFRQLPLVPGQVFGAQAQEVLDRRLLASEMRSKHLRKQTTFRIPAQYFQYSHRGNYPRQQRGSGFGQSRMQEVLAPPRQPRAVSRFNVSSRCSFTSRAQPATNS